MDRSFPETLSALRREKNINQRTAAAELGNGAREPGLSFVCRACDYYGVSADYLLGRSDLPDAASNAAETAGDYFDRLRALIGEAENALNEYATKELNQ